MIAVCRIRKEPHYRRAAFEAGLIKAGYTLYDRLKTPADPRDCLVLWNRQFTDQDDADAWEKAGGLVAVAENGYLQKVDKSMYAISVHGHNGSGYYPVGDADRFSALGFELKPWRTDGKYILVCAQRGVGSRLMASPPGWETKVTKRLQALTNRPIKIRMHPGNHAPKTPLEADLADAYACVIWSSSSGVRALTLGVPVFFDAPAWICEMAGRPVSQINEPLRDDAARRAAMHAMSYGQWTVAEIEAGEPFVRILEQRTAAAC